MSTQKRFNNKPNNSKNGKPNNYRSSKSKVEEQDVGRSTTNDPEWYMTNSQLLKDTSSIPFTMALGTRLNHGALGDRHNSYAVPGIMRINYVPTIGYSDHVNDPVNICARNTYSFIKSFNSRAKTYDAADLMQYILAMDSVFAYHEWMKRLYGIMNTVSALNRYYPEAIVRACGGDYQDLIGNITQLRAYINMFATRVQTLPLPRKFNIFKRHQWLVKGVYLDDVTTSKPQSYVFTPSGFHRFELDDDGAGILRFDRLPSEEMTFEQIKDFGEALIGAIRYGAGEEDFNLIGSDIFYSYGAEGVQFIEPISESYSVMPEFQQVVCDQINNLRAFGEMMECDIYQSEDKSHLKFTPVIKYGNLRKPWNDALMDQIVNLSVPAPTPIDVVEATRLTIIPENWHRDDGEGGRLITPMVMGTEVVENFKIYYYATLTGTLDQWKLYRSDALTSYMTVKLQPSGGSQDTFTDQVLKDATVGVLDYITQVSAFNHHPIIQFNYMRTDLDGVTLESDYVHTAFTNYKTYGIVTKAELESVHEVALYGLFAVDKYGTK